RVHRQHHLHAGQRDDLLGPSSEAVVVEGGAPSSSTVGGGGCAGGGGGGVGRVDEARVAVGEVERGVRGEHVEVPVALDVGHPDALGLRNDDGERVIGVRRVAVLELDLVRALASG